MYRNEYINCGYLFRIRYDVYVSLEGGRVLFDWERFVFSGCLF